MDRRRLIVPAVRFFAGFFLVAGIAALVVGMHDVTGSAGRLGVLFPAVLLLLAGAIFIGAAWKLMPIARPRKWQKGQQPPCEQPVPLAFLVSILLGVYVFFGALAGAGVQQGIVFTVALVFIGVGAVGFGLFWDKIEVSLVRVGATVALTVAGLLIGGWEFWYQNQYVPSHLDRAVSVQVGLKKLRTQGGYDLLSATLGYQDIGSRAVLVLGSAYTLTGSTVIACPRKATPEKEAGFFAGQLPDPQRARFMSPVWEIRRPKVLVAGTFAPEGRRLAPDAPASQQLILYVPHNRYQLLRLRAQVFAISASVPLAAQRPKTTSIKDDKDVYKLWKLEAGGWFQNLLSGSRSWVVTRYEIVDPDSKAKNPPAAPDVRVIARFPKPTLSGQEPSADQIKNLFQASQPLSETETFSDAELPLKPVAKPTGKEIGKAKVPCRRAGGPTKLSAAAGH